MNSPTDLYKTNLWESSFNYAQSFQLLTYLNRYYSRSSITFWEELVKGIIQIGCFQDFKNQIAEFKSEVLTSLFLMIKNIFL